MRVTGGILLIEDNAFDAKVFRHAARTAGIELPVTVAKDGVEALEILRQRHDALDMLIVTDLKMPRMSGIEFIRRIRGMAEIAHLPIFVVTTSNLPSDHDDALALGIEGYIRKSGDETEMIEPILAYLAQHGDRAS